MSDKTDNTDLPAKLSMRRDFLKRYGPQEGRAGFWVLDACAGEGKIWGVLRKEFQVKYVGVDRKISKRTLIQDDSLRVMARPLPYDVIDIDTYGDPWTLYFQALEKITEAGVTFFLTWGVRKRPGTRMARRTIEAMGIENYDVLPVVFHSSLSDFALPHCVHQCRDHGYELVEGQYMYVSAKLMMYVGLRLKKIS